MREKNAAARQGDHTPQADAPSDSFDKQAKSLYFDLGANMDQSPKL